MEIVPTIESSPTEFTDVKKRAFKREVAHRVEIDDLIEGNEYILRQACGVNQRDYRRYGIGQKVKFTKKLISPVYPDLVLVGYEVVGDSEHHTLAVGLRLDGTIPPVDGSPANFGGYFLNVNTPAPEPLHSV